MKSLTRLAPAIAAVAITAGAVAGIPTGGSPETARAASADAHIAHWDAVAMKAALSPGNTPAEQLPVFAYLSIAVYDSVVAIEGGYQPFLIGGNAPAGASPEAATAGAARTILLHYLPAQAATIEEGYTTALALIPDGPSEDTGVAFGKSVADQVIAARANDGFKAQSSYTPPAAPLPGEWVPSGATPIGAYSGQMKPFAVRSNSQFRPGGPPSLDTQKWERDYNEVKLIGAANSWVRTPAQTLAARFWGENPVAQAHGGYRHFIAQHGLDLVDSARFMAMMGVTQADAFNACFDAKYAYTFWRPTTAIRNGDSDGNPGTVGDPAWTQLLGGIPNHPEYTSAHSCITTAAAEVLSRFLKTERIGYTIPSLTGLGDRYYATAGDLVTEVGEARIWGGIHFRSAVDDGSDIGRKVAHQVLAKYFKPAK